MYSIHISLDTTSRLRIILNQELNLLEVFYIDTEFSSHFYTLKRVMETKELWSQHYGFDECNIFITYENERWQKEFQRLEDYRKSHKFETGDIVKCSDNSYGIVVDIAEEQYSPKTLLPFYCFPKITVLRTNHYIPYQLKNYSWDELELADKRVLYHASFTKLKYRASRSNKMTDIVNNTIDYFRLLALEEKYPFKIGDHVRYCDLYGVILRFCRLVNGRVVYSLTPWYSHLMNGEDVFVDVVLASYKVTPSTIPTRINIEHLLKHPLSYYQENSLYFLPKDENPLLNTAVSLYNDSLQKTWLNRLEILIKDYMSLDDLSLEERETHINQSADNRSIWTIYTDDTVMVKRLNKVLDSSTLFQIDT